MKAIRITENVLRGPFAGGSDTLKHTPVMAVHTVRQGVNGYTARDYFVDGNEINWSPLGLEPSPGSTYQVNYDFIESED